MAVLGLAQTTNPPQKDGWIAMTTTDRIKHAINDAYFKGLIPDRSQATLENAVADALSAYFIAKSRSARMMDEFSRPRKAA
jgi:hypothetical protein